MKNNNKKLRAIELIIDLIKQNYEFEKKRVNKRAKRCLRDCLSNDVKDMKRG